MGHSLMGVNVGKEAISTPGAETHVAQQRRILTSAIELADAESCFILNV